MGMVVAWVSLGWVCVRIVVLCIGVLIVSACVCMVFKLVVCVCVYGGLCCFSVDLVCF